MTSRGLVEEAWSTNTLNLMIDVKRIYPSFSKWNSLAFALVDVSSHPRDLPNSLASLIKMAILFSSTAAE